MNTQRTTNNEQRRKRGFTLVELLVAIAVIGILISLLIPAVGKVMESARRAKGANNVKQIALAYNQYAFDDVNGRTIPRGTSLSPTDPDTETYGAKNNTAWAIELARKGYLNDPSVYCFSGDSMCSKIVEKSIATEATATETSAWADVDSNGIAAWSVCVATNVPSDAPLSTTPVVCTRGMTMTTNGKVNKNIGVYKDKGGYIGFLDGHVEWFEDLGVDEANGKLINYYSHEPTNTLTKALPEGCWWLCGFLSPTQNGEKVVSSLDVNCAAPPEGNQQQNQQN